jgi:CheY-like chemotaxis protein
MNIRPILIIEDDQCIRELLQEALEEEGYLVWTAVNGQDGLNKMGSLTKPCLVLLDMMMPVMGGREFLNSLLADQTLASIPVIVISAIADSENTVGATTFLRKPPDLETIVQLAEQYCS